MKLLGYVLVKSDELPFIKDVHKLIDKKPEYLQGIRQGVVHVAFDPGKKPVQKEKEMEGV